MKQMKDRPFVLLGINSDSDRDKLKQVIAKEEITWRSWWDGGSTDGPIASRWNVMSWPTIYLIDHNGTIRYKGVRDEDLITAIELLVKEAEAAGKRW